MSPPPFFPCLPSLVCYVIAVTLSEVWTFTASSIVTGLSYWVACTQRSHFLCCLTLSSGPAALTLSGRARSRGGGEACSWNALSVRLYAHWMHKGRCFLQTKNGLQIILHPKSNSIHWYLCSFSRMLGLKGYPRCHPGKPSHLTNEEAEVSRG